MSLNILLWVIIIGFVICIIINAKLKINIGVPALLCAYIVGCWILKMKVTEVVACWPTNIMFQIITITMFFSFAVFNDTLPLLARKLLYSIRNFPIALPFILIFIGMAIGLLGSPAAGSIVILAVLTFSIATPAGLNPWLALIIVGYGSGLGSFAVWSVSGTIISTTADSLLGGIGDRAAWTTFVCYIIFTLIYFFVFAFATKGFKNLVSADMEKPEPFNKKQKINLVIVLCVAILVIVPNLAKIVIPNNAFLKTYAGFIDIRMVAIVGTFVCAILKLGDLNRCINNGVPWKTIMQIGGVATFLGIASSAGVTDYIGELISASGLSPILVAMLFSLMGSAMSVFSSAINTVFPMLAAIAVPYAVSANIDPVPILVGIAIGALATTVSPFSTAGALMIANCYDEKIRDGLFMKCIVIAICGAILAALLALSGIYKIF